MSDPLKTLDFSGCDPYTPYEGGGHDFLGVEGHIEVKIDSTKVQTTKDGSKGKLKIGLICQDEDVKGCHIFADVLYTGTDKNGNKLIRQFFDVLASTGTPVERINTFITSGAQMSIDDACQQLHNKTAYVEVRNREWEGNISTSVENFVTKDLYETYKSTGRHRKTSAPAQATSGTLNFGGSVNGAAASAPPASVATNTSVPRI